MALPLPRPAWPPSPFGGQISSTTPTSSRSTSSLSPLFSLLSRSFRALRVSDLLDRAPEMRVRVVEVGPRDPVVQFLAVAAAQPACRPPRRLLPLVPSGLRRVHEVLFLIDPVLADGAIGVLQDGGHVGEPLRFAGLERLDRGRDAPTAQVALLGARCGEVFGPARSAAQSDASGLFLLVVCHASLLRLSASIRSIFAGAVPGRLLLQLLGRERGVEFDVACAPVA